MLTLAARRHAPARVPAHCVRGATDTVCLGCRRRHVPARAPAHCVRGALAARAAGTARSVSASDSTRDAITLDARGARRAPRREFQSQWGGTRACACHRLAPAASGGGGGRVTILFGPGGFVESGAPIDVSGGAGGGVGTTGSAGVLDIAFVPELARVPEPAILVLLGTGVLGLLGFGWMRRRAAPA